MKLPLILLALVVVGGGCEDTVLLHQEQPTEKIYIDAPDVPTQKWALNKIDNEICVSLERTSSWSFSSVSYGCFPDADMTDSQIEEKVKQIIKDREAKLDAMQKIEADLNKIEDNLNTQL